MPRWQRELAAAFPLALRFAITCALALLIEYLCDCDPSVGACGIAFGVVAIVGMVLA